MSVQPQTYPAYIIKMGDLEVFLKRAARGKITIDRAATYSIPTANGRRTVKGAELVFLTAYYMKPRRPQSRISWPQALLFGFAGVHVALWGVVIEPMTYGE